MLVSYSTASHPSPPVWTVLSNYSVLAFLKKKIQTVLLHYTTHTITRAVGYGVKVGEGKEQIRVGIPNDFFPKHWSKEVRTG